MNRIVNKNKFFISMFIYIGSYVFSIITRNPYIYAVVTGFGMMMIFGIVPLKNCRYKLFGISEINVRRF